MIYHFTFSTQSGNKTYSLSDSHNGVQMTYYTEVENQAYEEVYHELGIIPVLISVKHEEEQ